MATKRNIKEEMNYQLFGENEIKLDFKNMLNMSEPETTDEVDEISNDVQETIVKSKGGGGADGVCKRFESSLTRTWDSTVEVSLEKERADMAETFENEKSDIVKGFILEKRVLNREHEKEKEDLITNFVQERQRMLDSFQQQVKDIEQKMSSKKTPRASNPPSEKVFDLSSKEPCFPKEDQQPASTPGKLLIKVDGKRILTPEQFLSAMELEERFESEKETIEKSFRKEKHLLKDKMEVEFGRRLLREKEKHEKEMGNLRKEINKLRNLKSEVSDVWKTQASQLETEFFKERSTMERHHSEEKDKLRRRLEQHSQSKLTKQQEEYDRMIRDLRGELRQIKKEVTSRSNENVSKEASNDLRKEVERQVQSHYESETRLLRQQNEKLSNEIQNLTTEKYDMSRKLRELEYDKSNESNFLQQHVEKTNKEYEEKMKKIVTQNDKLKSQISTLEKQKDELKLLAKNQQNNTRSIEGRLEITERTIIQYEDTVTGLRRENSNLSHEIHLLRIEKEELASIITQHNEQERSIKVDAQRLQHDIEESKKKCVLIEREKLKAVKSNEALKKDLERSKNELKKGGSKMEAYSKETERLRNLLEGERSENKRLHERFKTDAELLRKKEGENATTRTQLDNLKTQFETLKTRIEADNDKFFKLEKDRQSLQKQVDKFKSSGTINNKHEMLKVQNSYCKEFAKRLEYVKANYEREIFNLKERIGELTMGGLLNQENHQAEIALQHQAPPLPQHCRSCTSSALSVDFKGNHAIHNLPIAPCVYNVHQQMADHCQQNAHIAQQTTPTSHHKDEGIVRTSSEQDIRERLVKQRNGATTHDQNIQSEERQPTTTTIGVGTEESMANLYTRMQLAEDTSDNNELRILLRDVRKEVLMLNKLIDEQTPENSPRIEPRLTPPTKDPGHHGNKNINKQDNNLMDKIRMANQKTLDLQDQLADRESEVNESKETLQRLYFENNELQRRLDLQQEELMERENSCDELYKRRLMLEKLVDRLQGKLRDETSKRRQLEQKKNFIPEEQEDDLDESTV